MWYKSERFGKPAFVATMVALLVAVFLIGIGSRGWASIVIVSAMVSLFTVAYPYFYFVVRGYYPSGYYLPVEEVNKVTIRNLATWGSTRLSRYRNVQVKTTSSVELLWHLKHENSSAFRDSFCYVAWLCRFDAYTPDSIIEHGDTAKSFINTWQERMVERLKEQVAESKLDKEYEFES